MRRLVLRHGHRLAELWRYYKIGVVNTVFGLSLYSLLVFLGLNLFVAQIVSHVIGVVFNYFMFTRHVFTDAKPHILRYITSYGVNYLIGLAFLTMFHHFVRSPYIAGFLSAMATSVINYIMLKLFVFRRRDARDGR